MTAENLTVYLGKAILCLLLPSILIILWPGTGFSQDKPEADTASMTSELSEVVVHAYEQSKSWLEQPAAVSYIDGATFDKYNNDVPVSAFNSVAGVHMDQRSPGSFRLNIRGSSLRSPFGVRDVKIYYNGVPFTDPSGNTYLNQLSLYDFGSTEIIKGPSGSLYGAGMGGTLLINSPLFSKTRFQPQASVEFGGGSYGLLKGAAALSWGKDGNRNEIRYADLKSEGYRDHTASRQKVLSYETRVNWRENESLDAFFHYTDLFYETPGALTAEEYAQDRRASRPAAGIFPSAEESQAAVHQKAFVAGLRHTYKFSPNFRNTTVVYGAYTDFINPTFRNYELRDEPHYGGRTVFRYESAGDKIQSNYWFGAELQQGSVHQEDYEIDKGNAGDILTIDKVKEFNTTFFAQGAWSFVHDWEITASFGLNYQRLNFTRFVPNPQVDFLKKYPLVFTPRAAVSKKINKSILFYANVSRGFSPPTVAEILPSTTVLNKDLEAEKGMNYEIGSKGILVNNKLTYDVGLFFTRLSQSISLRKDAAQADFFVNAGGADQKGIEVSLNYDLYKNENALVTNFRAWINQSLFDFKYRAFLSEDKDFSGNQFPGTPSYTAAAGLDLETRLGLAAHVTYFHAAKIALNDDNNVYAKAYDLLGLRLSYEQKLGSRLVLGMSVGGDNLLDQQYSLGDDINAFGGRYYNAAAPANFYVNAKLSYSLGK